MYVTAWSDKWYSIAFVFPASYSSLFISTSCRINLYIRRFKKAVAELPINRRNLPCQPEFSGSVDLEKWGLLYEQGHSGSPYRIQDCYTSPRNMISQTKRQVPLVPPMISNTDPLDWSVMLICWNVMERNLNLPHWKKPRIIILGKPQHKLGLFFFVILLNVSE